MQSLFLETSRSVFYTITNISEMEIFKFKKYSHSPKMISPLIKIRAIFS